eukprot:17706-Heterococcus_DN1.PRE.3
MARKRLRTYAVAVTTTARCSLLAAAAAVEAAVAAGFHFIAGSTDFEGVAGYAAASYSSVAQGVGG